MKMRRNVRRIHWHTPENEKTNNPEVINDQMDYIFNPRADGEGTNSPRLFTPGETKALGSLKFINERGRGSPTVLECWVGGHPH
jgi:hypothetical protein